MGRWPVVVLWLAVVYLGVALAITLARCHFRFGDWEQREFWLLTGLVGLGYAVLGVVAIWITRGGGRGA
jgi:hypothetical protein